MSIRLLIADDHEVVRTGLKSLLNGTDIEIVAEAANGEDAIRLAAETKPDVVLLDMLMPDRDGLETLNVLRAYDPTARIIITSGGGKLSPEFYFDFSRRMQVDTHLAKPFSMLQLESAVHRALNLPRRQVTPAEIPQAPDASFPTDAPPIAG